MGFKTLRLLIWFLQVVTRRERLKAALYLRLKKRKVLKIVKRGPFVGVFENAFCCKTPKNLTWDPLDTKKIKKIAQYRKKIEGGAYFLVRFCILRLKWSKRKGTLCTNLDAFPIAGPVV